MISIANDIFIIENESMLLFHNKSVNICLILVCQKSIF